MLTNDDKKWIVEIMDDRFDKQDKRIDEKFAEQDKRMEEFFYKTETELNKQVQEHLRHIDVVLENYWDKLATALEVLPGANKSYDMLERRVEAIETDCSILKQVVVEKSTA